MHASPKDLTLRPLQECDLDGIQTWDSVHQKSALAWLLLDPARPSDSWVALMGTRVVGLLPVVCLGDPHPPERLSMSEWGAIALANGIDEALGAEVGEALFQAWLRNRADPSGVVLQWQDRRESTQSESLGFERVGCWSVLEGLPKAMASGCEEQVQALPLDQVASEFISACVGDTPFMARRSPSWMDWRYGRAPGKGFAVRGVVRGDAVLALAVVGPPRPGEGTAEVLPLVEYWVGEGASSAGRSLIDSLGQTARQHGQALQLALPPWHPAFTEWVAAGLKLTPTPFDLFARPAAWEGEGRLSGELWRRRCLDLEGLRCAWHWALGDVHLHEFNSNPGSMGS